MVFFNIMGIILVEWAPNGQPVDRYYYNEVLIKLRERVTKKRPNLWKNDWVLYQAPAHSVFSTQRLLPEKIDIYFNNLSNRRILLFMISSYSKN